MEDTENFVSHLPQPSRNASHSPSKGLTEAKVSVHNSRIGGLVPPGVFTGHKRQGSQCLLFQLLARRSDLPVAVPEPALKQRKTQVERAAETLRQVQAAAPSVTTVNSAANTSTSSRNVSNTSSLTQSQRTTSSASRNTSHASIFSASTNTGIRPPTSTQQASQLARPKTALAKERATKAADTRPKSSHGMRGGLYDGLKPKRMVPQSQTVPNRCGSDTRSTEQPPTHAAQEREAHWILAERGDPFNTADSQATECDVLSATPLQTSNPDQPVVALSSQPLPSLNKSPRPVTPARISADDPGWSPLPFPKSPTKTSPRKKEFLTRYSNLVAWDPEEQYGNMERMYQDVCQHYRQAMDDGLDLKETNNVFKVTAAKLEQDKANLTENIISLKCELQTIKYRLESAENSRADLGRDKDTEIRNLEDRNQRQIEQVKVEAQATIQDLKQHHRKELDDTRESLRVDIERLKLDHRDELKDLRDRLGAEVDKERTARVEAISQASSDNHIERQKQKLVFEAKDHEIRNAQLEAERTRTELERERALNDDLRRNLTTAGANATTMEAARQALQAKIEFLESDSKSQSEAYAAMEDRMNEAIHKALDCEERLRKEETMRKRLHNQVQELKGNIRVFCRVRPMSGREVDEEEAKFTYPDTDESNEIEIRGQEETNSLGKVTTKTHPFAFDRVFNPSSTNRDIFDEIGQLIQSALDGYNVCIFAYGQTGSGKTYTMSSEDGMIPRALRQIYETSKELGTRGWTYTIEGSFVEVYNEEIRDLLGKEGANEKSNKKHEIRHDMLKCETTITDVTTLSLDSPAQVEDLLSQAMARRSVAATNANERSSRSHSVFILKLAGHNSITGEKTKGTLNLVDLAGSERLSHSKAEGARLKETQNINKSLSCLGDVIGALGQQQQQPSAPSFNPRESVNNSSSSAHHIPYRNSKLTYLLQFSLGGNSKTLMFVMVAPEKKCLGETITSLKFADKVARTKIGIAKKVVGR